MKKAKRLLALLLVAVMAMGVLAGCGGNNAEDDVVTLTWYILGDTTLPDNEEVYQVASDMVYEDLGFRVNIKPIDSGSYNDKIKMIIAGGEDWDICWTSNWLNDYASNVASGAYMEIDELLNEAPALRDSINEKIWEGTKIGGKLYGVPVQQIMARNAAISMPLEFWEKYNDTLKGVDSYADMGEYLKAYSADYPNTGKVDMNWQNLCYDLGFDEIIGVAVPGAVSLEGDPNDIKVFNQFDTDILREIAVKRREWTVNGYTRKGTDGNASGSNSKPEEEPFIIDCYKPGYEIMREASTKYPVKVFTISDSYLTSAGINATLHAINSMSKHPVEAIKFLEYANTTPEFVNLLVYGIEGKHYEKVDDVTVRRIENSGYQNNDWCIANVFNTYVMEGQPADAHAQTKALNDNAKKSKLLGFTPDLEPIKVEIANCKSVKSEYFSQISEGLAADPIAHLAEMNEKFKTAGVDKIIAELQRQIDEWLKTK